MLFCCEATEMFRGNRSQSVTFLVYIKQASLLYTIQNKKNVGICCLDTDQTPNRTDFLSYQISAQWNLKYHHLYCAALTYSGKISLTLTNFLMK